MIGPPRRRGRLRGRATRLPVRRAGRPGNADQEPLRTRWSARISGRDFAPARAGHDGCRSRSRRSRSSGSPCRHAAACHSDRARPSSRFSTICTCRDHQCDPGQRCRWSRPARPRCSPPGDFVDMDSRLQRRHIRSDWGRALRLIGSRRRQTARADRSPHCISRATTSRSSLRRDGPAMGTQTCSHERQGGGEQLGKATYPSVRREGPEVRAISDRRTARRSDGRGTHGDPRRTVPTHPREGSGVRSA